MAKLTRDDLYLIHSCIRKVIVEKLFSPVTLSSVEEVQDKIGTILNNGGNVVVVTEETVSTLAVEYSYHTDLFDTPVYKVWLSSDKLVYEYGRTLESATASLRLTHPELQGVKLVVEF